ncbi:FtsX-like permease family protein [Bifidobacterium sp. 64T4]|nr:FtsX-like permease family protein [Bifidobacterium pongonis]
MRKRMLNKDIIQTLAKSKGRFVSIMCLMALGSFALVGLMVTGPDMRVTGRQFYGDNNLADITVISDYGLSKDDQNIIKRTDGVQDAEFGYFKDVTIKNTSHSIRIYSKPEKTSTYRVTKGRLPQKKGEIALASKEQDKYAIDSSIRVEEQPDIAGDTVLTENEFTVVGFVDASDIVSDLNEGQSTAGAGVLNGYAVVTEDTFDSDVAMVGKVTFKDTSGVDYWTDEYRDLVQKHKDTLTKRLANQPKARQASIRETRREQIDKAKQQVKDAKQQLADSQQQLDDADKQIADAKNQLQQSEIDAVQQAATAQAQLSTAQAQIDAASSQLVSAQVQLDGASQQLASGQQELNESWQQLSDGKQQLDEARTQLEATKTVLDKTGQMLAKWEQTGLTGKAYEQLKAKYDQYLAQYNQSVSQYNQKLAQYNQGLAQWQNGAKQLDQGSKQYEDNASQIASAANQLANKQTELGNAQSQLATSLGSGVQQLIEGQNQIESAEKEYQSKLDEFNKAKPEAEAKIAKAEQDIKLAEEKVDTLEVPAYSVDSRREGLTSEGYRVYEIIADIVNKLAGIFPAFLYLVAALVTFTTMGRMVDEERTNSGTLKALGYGNADVMRKFTIYGFAASTAGTIIGAAAGQTILPLIVYHAYSSGFTMPGIRLDFHPWITLMAFVLAWVSAIVPAWLVASKELREKPAALLLPKPPANGSKIFLERITPIWNRLNFTHKVTARNIFRYKMRMFMTVFGVCGAVALLTAGLSVQHSIQQIEDSQFGNLIHYDLIVAERSDNNADQRDEVAKSMKRKTVSSSTPIRYEQLTKTAGKSNDKQTITMIATDDAYNFGDYLTLRDRSTHESQVLTDKGAIISESMANMLHVKVGDTITVTDSDDVERTVRVDGITEMYIGHFMVMTFNGYEHVFHKDCTSNGYMVKLKDGSEENAAKQGAKFMELSGVQSVVQNITQKKQVRTIVNSLNQIMEVLVIVAAMLAVVILYNLTNLNVSERIRELSTIKVLGFHSNETTMYIYRETILLSGLGILVGYGFGAWLHEYIITEVPPDEVMFDPSMGWLAFVAPLVVVGVVLAVLGWVVYRRLRDVDMLAALKSVE